MIYNSTRSLSTLESGIILGLAEDGRTAVSRQEIAERLGARAANTDRLIRSLRLKGWLEPAGWGRYVVIPPERGSDVVGESNVLALAAHIADPYYLGYGTAAAHYGFTTQSRRVIWLVTPQHVRPRDLHGTAVRVVHPAPHKFFGFG